MKLKRKINKTIIIPFMVLMLLSITGITIITTRQNYNNLHSSMEEQNLQLVEQISELQRTTAKSYIRATGDIINGNINKISNAVKNSIIEVDDFTAYLSKYLYTDNLFYDGYIYLVNRDGVIINHPYSELINSESMNKVWILSNRSQEFYEYRFEERDKIAYKLFNPELDIYIIATAFLDSFYTSLDYSDLDESIQNIRYGKSGYPMLFDVNGIIKSHPDKSLLGINVKDLVDYNDEFVFKDVLNTTSGRIVYKLNDDYNKNSKKLLYYNYNNNSKLYICSIAYFYEYFNSLYTIILICLIGAIFIILIMWLISERLLLSITKPITYISNASKRISENEFNTVLLNGEIDEINTLSKSITLMRDHLKSIIDELSKSKAELEIKVEERTRELREVIEELKTTQDQLILTEKMSSLNGLVAGVAHEINTPIGISVTAASHLEEKMLTFNRLFLENKMTKSSFIEFLDDSVTVSRMILGSLRKASDLITSFKSLAANQTYDEIGEFNINSLIDELILSLNHLLKPKNIVIHIDCKIDTYIYSYPGALSQLFLILIQNSIVHGFDGLETGNININIKKEDDDVIIYYKDNGVGINPDNIKKIFEPFYTTKRNRGGTGLGLHILYNIVSTNLNGSVACYSEVGSFTEFIIRFTAIEEL